MDVSVLVPWRSSDPQRIRVWDYCKDEWERHGVEICEGVDSEDGPFNTAKACNSAFRKSTRSYLLTMGADIIPGYSLVKVAVKLLEARSARWIPVGDRTEYFNEETTERILSETTHWSQEETDPQYTVPFQTGIMLIRRDLYLETGGHDERFTGWGGEDAAFRRSVHILGGDSEPVPLTLRCLWHDPGRRGTMSQNNYALCHQYDNTHTREGMLQLIQERGRYV